MKVNKLDQFTILMIVDFTLATLSAAMHTSITTHPPSSVTINRRRNLTSSSITSPPRLESAPKGGVETTGALVYLQRYGYMQQPSGAETNNLVSEDSFSEAVAEFQRFAGLAQTGNLDYIIQRLD